MFPSTRPPKLDSFKSARAPKKKLKRSVFSVVVDSLGEQELRAFHNLQTPKMQYHIVLIRIYKMCYEFGKIFCDFIKSTNGLFIKPATDIFR